jgi:hypothetical protein
MKSAIPSPKLKKRYGVVHPPAFLCIITICETDKTVSSDFIESNNDQLCETSRCQINKQIALGVVLKKNEVDCRNGEISSVLFIQDQF